MNRASIAVRSAVPGRFSQIPSSPMGLSAMIRTRGNMNAADTEIEAAKNGFPIADMKHCVQIAIHLNARAKVYNKRILRKEKSLIVCYQLSNSYNIT